MRQLTNLLLVDDEWTDLTLMERSFAKSAPDINVTSCQGSEDASKEILKGDADIILLDINMPGLNGFDILNRAREMHPGTFPTVIMLSTSENPEDIRRSYSEGAAAYVVKPSSMDGYNELAQSVAAFWAQVVARPV